MEAATALAIQEYDDAREAAEEAEKARLEAIDWNAPDEEEEKSKARAKRENPIPEHLRDIFEKDAKKSKRRSSGAVTTGVRLEGIQKSFKVGTKR